MSMEHKAYIFDSELFELKLKNLILECIINNDIKKLRGLINNNIKDMKSPYDGESLKQNWENQIEIGNVQEYSDFVITCCYSPNNDIGLSYSWDSLLENLTQLKLQFKCSYYILGKEVKQGRFVLNPGGYGLGIVCCKDISSILSELMKLKSKFFDQIELGFNNGIYTLTKDELEEAYNDLILIYRTAFQNNKGILFTF